MTMRLRLTGTFVLVFGIFVFAGSALAGNGNGNGNGNGSSGAPGNSASAPGQVKKDAPPAGAETTTVATTTVADQNAAPTAGVKPANDTAHDTRAPASSSATKLYGNGQTAGGIALHHGASPSTRLHGPGNSQPHKAAPCSGGHEVDVHERGSVGRAPIGRRGSGHRIALAKGRSSAGARNDRTRSGAPVHGRAPVDRRPGRPGADRNRARAPTKPNPGGCHTVRA